MYYPVGSKRKLISTFWNPLDAHASTVAMLSNDNYQVTATQNKSLPDIITPQGGLDTYWHNSEKVYFEIIIDMLENIGAGHTLVFGLRHRNLGFSHYDSASAGARMFHSPESQTIPVLLWGNNVGDGAVFTSGGDPAAVVNNTNEFGFGATDRLMIALDFVNRLGFLGKNNAWMNNADPAAGTNAQWDWNDIQDLQPDFFWRFFFFAGGNNFVTDPLQFRLATGGTRFPQHYVAPTGFTRYNPPAAADFYGGFNFWESHTNGGADSFQSSAPNWDLVRFTVGGTLFINQTSMGRAHALLYPGGKYYWETGAPTASATRQGIMSSGHLTSAEGVVDGANTPTAAILNADGTLDSKNGITKDATGVTPYGNNEIIMNALDLVTGKYWLGIDGTWFNSGNPSAGTNPQFTNVPTDEVLAACVAILNASRGWGLVMDPANLVHSIPTGFSVPIVIPEYVP